MGLYNTNNNNINMRFINPRALPSLHRRHQSSNLSTSSVHDDDKKNKVSNQTTSSRRRRKKKVVHFAERKQVHVYNQRVDDDNHQDVWYNGHDFAAFQQQAERDAADLRELLNVKNGHDDDVQKNLAKALLDVYCAFRSATNAMQLLTTLNDIDLARAIRQQDVIMIAGLEQAQTDIAADFAVRRAHLLNQIARIQYYYHTNTTDKRDHLLAETSRLTSRVSRMFAQYTAVAAAAAQQQQ